MKIKLQGKNMELTEALQDYAEKRVTNLEKLLSTLEANGAEARVSFEVAKTTNHHKGGDVFRAVCRINVQGEDFYADADREDIYQAIDAVKDTLYNEINRKKDRRQTMLHRGARSVKKMMKGLSKRNPFTSKY